MNRGPVSLRKIISIPAPQYRKPIPPRPPITLQCLNIRAEEHLGYEISNGRLTLDVRTPDGIAAGKSFMQLMNSVDITGCSEAEVNLEMPSDLQFLIMYLAAPPGKEFMARFGSHESVSSRRVTVNLPNGAADALFNLITNTTNNKCALLQDIPSFKAEVVFRVPEEEIPALRQKARNAVTGLRKALPSQYHEQLTEKLAEIEAYIDQNVVALPEELTGRNSLRPGPANLRRTRELSREQISRLLDSGTTLATESDETTHISLEGNTMVLVDAGNPATATYVNALAEAARPREVKIFLTHFHADHTNGLAETLSTLRSRGINVELIIPEETLFQAMGYFTSNIKVLNTINSSARINIRTMAPGQELAINTSSSMHVMAPPASIGHYITSRGYVQINQEGQARCYSGDINPGPFNPATGKAYTDQEVQEGLRSYFFGLVRRAERQGAREVDLFIDYGHFPPPLQEYITGVLEQDLSNYCRVNRMGFNLHRNHQKNNTGYILRV